MHADIITENEAKRLGIIDTDGLGFVAPQTAYKNITERLLAEIKKGNLIWRQGWRSGVVVKGKTYGPQNYETQRPYTGGNAFFIYIQNLFNKTDYKFFLTAKQIKERGGKIRKGTKPFPVSVFIKNLVTVKVKVKGETKEVLAEETGIVWYEIFPIDLVDGLKEIVRKTHKPDTFNEIIVADADELIENMPDAPPIKHGGDSAFYSPSKDYVQLPLKKAFKPQQNYYSVAFHELIHSTGHSKRLHRGNDTRKRDGSKEDKKAYAFEELIAEIGAAYLCGVCEIDYYTINNSAAYLKGWANSLADEIKSDPNFLRRAVFKAARAANYIIGTTLEKHGIVKSTTGKQKELSGVTDTLLVFLNSVLAMHNRTVTKEDILFIIHSLHKAVTLTQIKKDHPLRSLASVTQTKLVKLVNQLKPKERVKVVIENKEAIEQKISSLHGLGFWNVIASAVVGKGAELLAHKHLFSKTTTTPALSGVMSVTQAINGKFDLIGLKGDYGKLIGEACKPTSFFIYGPGGSGKSSFTLKFSNYLAKQGNRVLYVAGEQFGTPVFSNMLVRLAISDLPNFVIVKEIQTLSPKGFDFIVIDSKDSLNFELEQFIAMRKQNPKLSFVILSQGTKSGNFTGSEKWRNEVDTLLYCEDLIVHSNLDKNRWGGSSEFNILTMK